MASGVKDITCVFVEVAGSYKKSYSVLGWCVVHQWCQNVLVRLTGGWNYLHYLFRLDYLDYINFFFHTVGNYLSHTHLS